MSDYNEPLDGPTADDLAAIEDEMPLIEAETDLVDVQIKLMLTHGPVDEVTMRRLYRSRDAVITETLRWYLRHYNATRRTAA